MMQPEELEGIDSISLNPLNYFHLEVDCHRRVNKDKSLQLTKYLLPLTDDISSEEAFSDFYMGWDATGLFFCIEMSCQKNEVFYPHITSGNSVELFIDTRDIKSAGFNHRFCHHFFFLPESVDGVQKGEKTHFRTEDRHELCNPKNLELTVSKKRKMTTIDIFIPSDCLVGYDPDQFDRLGFTYRINRYAGDPQHFCVCTDEYQIDQTPSLWSSIRLVK